LRVYLLSPPSPLRLEGGTKPDEAKFLSMLRSLSVLVSLHFDGTVVDLYQLALLGEMVTLWSFSFSSDLSPSGKFMIDGILNTIRCSALESLTISDLYSMDIVQPMELLSTQALPMPPLRSVKLSRFECAKFVEHFDFTHLLALDIISLRNCKSPMALLRFLLPSRGNKTVTCGLYSGSSRPVTLT
jgi:hypothetical protein